MGMRRDDVAEAIEIFVRGFCAGRSRTHPYLFEQIDDLWVMRDAPRRNPRNYRKEEWVAYGIEPSHVDRLARQHTRGRFFVCALEKGDTTSDELKAAYKRLGYRLLGTEPLFVHKLKRIARQKCSAKICRLDSPALATAFATATRSKPLSADELTGDAPFRQYVALEGKEIVGWVRSVKSLDSTWCANMHVVETCRRRGIGTALLTKMLRDDRMFGSRQSVLLSSRTGALLYPRVGYEQIATLRIFAPARGNRVSKGSSQQE